jgi:hypothetical protein
MGKNRPEKKGSRGVLEPPDSRPPKKEPKPDQLDDEGRRRHMGPRAPKDQRDQRSLEEGDPDETLGRPVRVEDSEPEPGR